MENVFVDIPRKEPSLYQNTTVTGDAYLNNTNELSVGFGKKVLRTDQQGLWLGSDKFATAPFKVDMLGNVTITGANDKMVLNDGVTNRIVIGNI